MVRIMFSRFGCVFFILIFCGIARLQAEVPAIHQQLNERGWHDVSLNYLEWIEKKKFRIAEFQHGCDLARAQTYLAVLAQPADFSQPPFFSQISRAMCMQRAEESLQRVLEKYAVSKSQNLDASHAQALLLLARLEKVRGKQRAGSGTLDDARKLFQAAENHATHAAKMANDLAKSERARGVTDAELALLFSVILQGKIVALEAAHQHALTFPEASPERKTFLERAISQALTMSRRYARYQAGLEAKLLIATMQKNLGNEAAARETLSELQLLSWQDFPTLRTSALQILATLGETNVSILAVEKTAENEDAASRVDRYRTHAHYQQTERFLENAIFSAANARTSPADERERWLLSAIANYSLATRREWNAGNTEMAAAIVRQFEKTLPLFASDSEELSQKAILSHISLLLTIGELGSASEKIVIANFPAPKNREIYAAAAVAFWNRYVALEPENPERAQFLQQAESFAEKYFATQSKPSDPFLLILQAEILLAQNRPEEASAQLDKTRDLSNEFPADFRAQYGDLRARIQKVLAPPPKSEMEILLGDGEYEKALALVTQKIAAEPKRIAFQNEAAAILTEWGMNAKDKKVLQRAVCGDEQLWGWDGIIARASQVNTAQANEAREFYLDATYQRWRTLLSEASFSDENEKSRIKNKVQKEWERFRLLRGDLGETWREKFRALFN